MPPPPPPPLTHILKVPADKPIIRDLTAAPTSAAAPAAGAAARGLVVGPHAEGSRVVLECETSGGWPEPSLSWWRDNRLVDDSYELVHPQTGAVIERRTGDWLTGASGGGDEQAATNAPAMGQSSQQLEQVVQNATGRLVRNRLELDPLSRAELLANYTCVARNTKLLGPAPTSSVVIDMNRKYNRKTLYYFV